MDKRKVGHSRRAGARTDEALIRSAELAETGARMDVICQ